MGKFPYFVYVPNTIWRQKMKSVNKILVPVAFSEYSEGIFKYAIEMATALDAELLVINVINNRDIEAVERITSYGFNVDSSHYLAAIRSERETLLNAMLENCAFPQERMRFISKVGKPSTELLKFAVQEEVDIIIMGIKGKTEFSHAFTGSVAEKLFRRSPITIVSYRDEKNAERLKKRILI